MREICKSGSEGGAGQINAPFLPLSLIARIRNMNSFTDAIVPCLLGAGLVLTGIHIKKAIYGYPKAILGACGSITGALDHSKSYYRSLASIVPTFLILLGFTVGAGLDRFWHQSDNGGFKLLANI